MQTGQARKKGPSLTQTGIFFAVHFKKNDFPCVWIVASSSNGSTLSIVSIADLVRTLRRSQLPSRKDYADHGARVSDILVAERRPC